MNDNYYATPDLALASLLSLWFPIEIINKDNPRKAVFAFKRDTHLEDIVESFWKRELKVEPLAYFNQLKIVKSRLYEEQEQ